MQFNGFSEKLITFDLQLEIGIPTISLVYLQDNQNMYIHKSIDYGINIRRKKTNNTQTYTMTYKKKSINTHKYSNYIHYYKLN